MSDTPTPTPSPIAPTAKSLPAASPPAGNPLAEAAAEATLAAFKAVDPVAYMEKLARTDPRLFFKYVALFTRAPADGADNRTQTIVNVMNAIPRSPLDELPEGFRVR